MIIPEIPEVLARMDKAKGKIISEIGTAMTTDLPAIRCNNCMSTFNHEDDLEFLLEEQGNPESGFNACPICKTDSYLMDLSNDE